MADCECLPGCLFFNDIMDEMPATADMLKERYCKGDSSQCARYMVFKTLGKDKVPRTLFPHAVEKAEQIIADA